MLSDLTVRQVKAADKPYALADFDDLFLNISPNGTKSWHFRFSWASKRDRISFGIYPALFLKEARNLRDEARALLAGERTPSWRFGCPTAVCRWKKGSRPVGCRFRASSKTMCSQCYGT